jgi:hypothetical protein
MAYTQTQLLAHDVFLVDRIDSAARDAMRHLKAVVFVRPTHESVQHIIDELRAPKYADYYLCACRAVRRR